MVEFKVVFNKKINEKLADIQIRKTKANVKRFSAILLMISSVLIAFSFCFWNNEDTFSWFLGIGIFGLVFAVLFPKILTEQIKKNYEKMSEKNSLVSDLTEEVYKFDEDKVYIFTTKGDAYRSAIETDYSYFSKIFEDNDSYILYISDMQCHIIFKNNLTKGTLEEFETILNKHFSSEKYIKQIENIQRKD